MCDDCVEANYRPVGWDRECRLKSLADQCLARIRSDTLTLTGREQVAKYDDGVGSSSFKPLALLGGAFGWGLKRNIIDLYKFVCRNYEPGARIYAFGFSRGAFTVRVLAGLILEEGLVPYCSELDLARARQGGHTALFRAEVSRRFFGFETVFRAIRNIIVRTHHIIVRATVSIMKVPKILSCRRLSSSACGTQSRLMAYRSRRCTRGVSQYIWPLYLPERTLNLNVRRACHALSLDDERTTFHPVLWSEKGEKPPAPDSEGRVWLKDERISQVWFPGVHANVGGGYPDDALRLHALVLEMKKLRFGA